MTDPTDLRWLVALGGAIGKTAKGEVVGRMFKNEAIRGRPKKRWQFKINTKTGCWEWQRELSLQGYGMMRKDGFKTGAHRHYFMHLRSGIPPNMKLDHLCRNTICVNPAHLEIVTERENIIRGVGASAQNARKTHCGRGHALSGENVEHDVQHGWPRRKCITCRRMMEKKRYARKAVLV